MKIITSDAVYVQKNDIIMLNHTDLAIPASIFMQVFFICFFTSKKSVNNVKHAFNLLSFNYL